MAIIALLLVNLSLGRYINDDSWKVISPQFSIAPAPNSGSATRSKLIQTEKKKRKKGIFKIQKQNAHMILMLALVQYAIKG